MSTVRFLAGLILLARLSTNAMFMVDQTESVPLDRLFSNLNQQLAKDTNNFQVTYTLARLHSMAYATNLVEVQVSKRDGRAIFDYPGSDSGVPRKAQIFHTAANELVAKKELTNAITLFERSLFLLKKSTNINEQRWMILPTQLGLAWCLDQSRQRDKALTAYRRALDIAWRMEVTGDFNLKEWLGDTWDDIKSGKNPVHQRTRGSIGPGVCYSEEIIGYLLKLLDPVKDASEVKRLQDRQATIKKMGRAITPILIPIGTEDELTRLVFPDAAVEFDLDGSGQKQKWGWIRPSAAWLVFDSSGKGEITSGLQLFGNVTFWIFWRDGYAALAALDDNQDGKLEGDELRGLALWRDANSNGVSDHNEVQPVFSYGIKSISCKNEPFSGEIKWNPQGVIFTNGAVRPTYDWIAPSK